MEEEGYSILGQASLLLRRILPLGIVMLVTVSIGILLILFASWLGEVLLQIPLQESVSAFIQNGILLSIAFALLGPLLSERVLSGIVQSKTPHSPKVELVPQMDLKVEEPEKPHKPGVFERFRDWLETDENRQRLETEHWEKPEPPVQRVELGPTPPRVAVHVVQKRPEIVPVAKPSILSIVETKPSIPTAMPKEQPNVEPAKPNDSKSPAAERPEAQGPTFAPRQRLGVKIDEMSFMCSMCSKTTSLPWEKVQQSQKGEQVTVDCQHCHNLYPFNYELAKGKMLSGKITAL